MLDLMHLERLPVAEIKFVGGGASTFDEMVNELVQCARDDKIGGNKTHGPILVLWRMNDLCLPTGQRSMVSIWRAPDGVYARRFTPSAQLEVGAVSSSSTCERGS